MTEPIPPVFDLAAYLTTAGAGRKIVRLKAKETFYLQGGPADSIFYLRVGRGKMTVVSKNGKEATITLVSIGEFIGEEAIADGTHRRSSTATAITACLAVKIDKHEMIRLLSAEKAFSALFLKYLLKKSMRTQADLIDQLFNSAEKRLARTLLVMADYGESAEPDTLIPYISQETLAEMIGTTRSRVSHFMNQFRKLGYIEYKSRIRVHKSLLNAVLQDHLQEENAKKPPISKVPTEADKVAGPKANSKQE